MNVIKELRNIENRIFETKNESVDLVGAYLSKGDTDRKKIQEALEKGAIDRAVRVLQGNRKNLLKEDYYTVKYSYYTDDDQIESNSVTFGDAQSAKDLSDNLRKSLKGNLIYLDWDIEDEDQTRDWELLDRKTITDFDGFTTDYTLWKKNNEDYWVCVFGDSDIYGPEDGEFDAEFETEREAREWFDDYSGFEDDELEFAHEMESEPELATDDMNAGQWYEGLDKKNLKESKKGTVEQMWDGDTYSYHLYVDGKKVGSFWEFDDVEEFAKDHDIILEESFSKQSLKEGDENLHQLYKLYWNIVKASKEFDPWYIYDYIFSVIKNKDYADDFKKAVKPLSDDELGEMDSEQVIDHIFDSISGKDYELQFSKDFMSGLWDYFPESLNKKNLKEGFDEILSMVKGKTEDFSLRNGFITCDTEEEKDLVIKLLKRYYDDVEAEAETFKGEEYYNIFFADPSWEQLVDESFDDMKSAYDKFDKATSFADTKRTGKPSKEIRRKEARRNELRNKQFSDGLTNEETLELNKLTKEMLKKHESMNESVYTDNGFKNRKDYLNSLADEYGVDVKTVYDLASVLGPDEDFDALVTEIEDLSDSQEADWDGGSEYIGKQFGLTSYYDDKLRGIEDSTELDWGDEPDVEEWIWDKCSQGFYVKSMDYANGIERIYRPSEEADIDPSDLLIRKNPFQIGTVEESLNLSEDLDYMLSDDELEKYKSKDSDRDFIGKKLYDDVSSVKELIPEATDEEAEIIEKVVDADDAFLYRAEDGAIIVEPLADDYFGFRDVKHFIEDMMYQYQQDKEFYE